MHDMLLWATLLTGLVAIVLLVVFLLRSSNGLQEAGKDLRKDLREELQSSRRESQEAAGALRQEVAASLKAANDTVGKTIESMATVQQNQLQAMTAQLAQVAESNREALERIRATFDMRFKEMQEGNEKKLEEMRRTVDEKLQSTLERRLGESFKLVSDRLDAVHKGLGEMQTLASGVGELKRVLTNVKARGTWAEVQLGAILEQVLTPAQYDKNVHVKPRSSQVVEYAVRLPGSKEDPNSFVWLPIDSKFPQEDYLRLQDAADMADADGVQSALKALIRAVRTAAKDIHDKYVVPPHTTDFGIMFLATEGLYAEVLRQPALVEALLSEYRVVVAGPTTLSAILSSLRIGFQTLAIEERASEVWKVLGAVKTEFGKFGDVLAKVQRQLETASHTIQETGVRTRAMAKRLRAVEKAPDEEVSKILRLDEKVGADTVSSDDDGPGGGGA
ncbi:MAG: DNA recombination protein RmuC [Deltaproteobacteria bacterium]|nr:DNA recombination protein RmuC [Deltaproteobacteria bacterium]